MASELFKLIKASEENLEELKNLAIQSHYSCGDNYYDCPHYVDHWYDKSDFTKECNCGTDEHNLKVNKLYGEIIGN